MTAKLNNTRVPLNRTATLTLRVEWHGGLGDLELDDPTAPESADLEISAGGASNEVASRDGTTYATKLYTYELKPTKVGAAEIAPISVTYREAQAEESQALQTPRLTLTVTESVSDGLSPQVRNGLVAFSAVLLLALLTGAIARARRALRETPELDEPDEQRSPAGQLLSRLEEHKALRIAGDNRGYCEAVGATLREYLAATYEVRAGELPTDRLLAALADAEANRELLRSARTVLERCDVVKFAGIAPSPPELDELHDHLKEIVDTSARAPDTEGPTDQSGPRNAQ